MKLVLKNYKWTKKGLEIISTPNEVYNILESAIKKEFTQL